MAEAKESLNMDQLEALLEDLEEKVAEFKKASEDADTEEETRIKAFHALKEKFLDLYDEHSEAMKAFSGESTKIGPLARSPTSRPIASGPPVYPPSPPLCRSIFVGSG